MKILTVAAAILLLSGCVNVHVHFPSAPAGQTESAGDKTP